jgi:hypothetical protein
MDKSFYLHRTYTGSGSAQPRIHFVWRAISLRVKQPQREVDHSLRFNTDIKNAWGISLLTPASSWRGAKLRTGTFPFALKRKHLIPKDAPSHCLNCRKKKCSKCSAPPQLPAGRYFRPPRTELTAGGIITAGLHQSTATKIDVLIIFSRPSYVRLVITPAQLESCLSLHQTPTGQVPFVQNYLLFSPPVLECASL